MPYYYKICGSYKNVSDVWSLLGTVRLSQSTNTITNGSIWHTVLELNSKPSYFCRIACLLKQLGEYPSSCSPHQFHSCAISVHGFRSYYPFARSIAFARLWSFIFFLSLVIATTVPDVFVVYTYSNGIILYTKMCFERILNNTLGR